MASNLRILLIIPTLNEAANIEDVVRTYLALPYDLRVIVADSDSPDGTGNVVRRVFGSDQRVILLDTSGQRGRGASIVFAYRWILEGHVPFDAIAVSDADFSHDPKDFSRLVDALEDSQVVIGSRYLPESNIVNWPWQRHLFSGAANLLARILLHVGIRDYTNGYRLFVREALEVLDLDRIDADGYIHLSQELLFWHRAGMKIVEVPTTFVNRKRGQSSFRLKLVFESLWVIVKLSRQK